MAKEAVIVGAWKTGSANTNAGRVAIVEFAFNDREMVFAIPVEEARRLAEGLLAAVNEVPPSQRN